MTVPNFDKNAELGYQGLSNVKEEAHIKELLKLAKWANSSKVTQSRITALRYYNTEIAHTRWVRSAELQGPKAVSKILQNLPKRFITSGLKI